MSSTPGKRIFTYEQAAELIPAVQKITADAVAAVDALATEEEGEEPLDVAAYERVVQEWAGQLLEMGLEVKGLWLVDFDSGSGYYCWQHPEPSLQHFHGYDEGFPGRVPLQ